MGRWVAKIRTQMPIANAIILHIIAMKRDWFLEVFENKTVLLEIFG
jgi:hypothetical protein